MEIVRMTPAINLAKKKNVPHKVHQYKHDPSNQNYGLEAVEALGQNPECVFKTLLFSLDGQDKNLVVAVIPVASKLNLKLAAKAAKSKKADMADPSIAQKTTGYIVGGISPIGQKKALPTFIHSSALALDLMCVSAGKRGLEIELTPEDLSKLTRAQFVDLCI